MERKSIILRAISTIKDLYDLFFSRIFIIEIGLRIFSITATIKIERNRYLQGHQKKLPILDFGMIDFS